MNRHDDRQERIARCLQSAVEFSADVAGLAYSAVNSAECLELCDALKMIAEIIHVRQIQVENRADLLCGAKHVEMLQGKS